MTTRHRTLIGLCVFLVFSVTVPAARLTLFIDGDTRTAYDASRGKVGRADWTAAVKARKGTILTNDFQGVNIDVPADTSTPVGHFNVFFSQTGGYSTLAGNTAPQKHPTGVFVGTTGTGSTAGKNDETIQGLELRYETLGPMTKTLELRFNPPIFAWSADVFSVDGKGFGQGGGPDSNDHTTLHVQGHSDLHLRGQRLQQLLRDRLRRSVQLHQLHRRRRRRPVETGQRLHRPVGGRG